ncbi:hypothetical protein [Entomohabitans teleogrylli]|uniref:hypothetical protein n=1 Tax=Entomohabitans teleogrylli TaxID=1384589 RepID=UPI00073D3B44|nr:hypothetical protein [Entomohabitans teleogrylli]
MISFRILACVILILVAGLASGAAAAHVIPLPQFEQRLNEFKQQTGVTLCLHSTSDSENQQFNAYERHLRSHQPARSPTLLLLIITDRRQLMVYPDNPQLNDLIARHAHPFIAHGLWFQGVHTAVDIVQSSLLHQPLPPLRWYPENHQDPWQTLPISDWRIVNGLLWIVVFFFTPILSSGRLLSAVQKGAVMGLASLIYQIVWVVLHAGEYTMNQVSPLWAVTIAFSAFFAQLIIWRAPRRMITTCGE